MKNRETLKCIIFDMDGCLVDTEAHNAKSWEIAFEIDGFEINPTVIEGWTGCGANYINNEVYKLTGDLNRSKKLRQLKDDVFMERLDSGKIELKPYAKEILSFTKDNKIKLGLVSSTFEYKALKILKYFKLLDYFDFMVFGNQVKNLKPDPEIYLLALDISKEDVANCLVFEDSVSGVKAAKAAGFTCIVHIPDSSIPKSQVDLNTFARIDDFKEGIDLIKKL